MMRAIYRFANKLTLGVTDFCASRTSANRKAGPAGQAADDIVCLPW
jgi:hypothetical protein